MMTQAILYVPSSTPFSWLDRLTKNFERYQQTMALWSHAILLVYPQKKKRSLMLPPSKYKQRSTNGIKAPMHEGKN